MGLRSTLSSLLSAPLLAVLEERLREIIDRQTEARGFADPSAIRELNTHVAHARRALDELGREVATQQTAVRALQQELDADEPQLDDVGLRLAGLDARDEQLRGGVDRVTAEARKLADQVTALRSEVDRVGRRLDGAEALAAHAARTAQASTASLTQMAPAPVVADAEPTYKTEPSTKGCKVEDCDGEHRARGFCARHYQVWKRGHLHGFVTAEGEVQVEDGPRFGVDRKLAGKPAAWLDGKLLIEGKATQARPL
jgi:hypothetical protein